MKIVLSESQFKRLYEELTKQEIDAKANEADKTPTEAETKAGNYRMGHLRIKGFDITIENPKGSKRYYNRKKGKYNIMQNHYGYFTRTKGKDGDQVDVFIGPDTKSFTKVYVVDQKINGKFDESKVMFGFLTKKEAKAAYFANFDKSWHGFMHITGVSLETFKKWLYRGRKQRQPFADYVEIKKKQLNESPDLICGRGGDILTTWGRKEDKPITFVKNLTTGKLEIGSFDDRKYTHDRIIADFYVSPEGTSFRNAEWDEGELRGRYFPELNIISFWVSPWGPKGKKNLSYVVSELESAGISINKKTLLVDVWENTGYNWNPNSSDAFKPKIRGFIPYVWFFDGFLDDFGDKIAYIYPTDEDDSWFEVRFLDGKILYCDLFGRMLTSLEYFEHTGNSINESVVESPDFVRCGPFDIKWYRESEEPVAFIFCERNNKMYIGQCGEDGPDTHYDLRCRASRDNGWDEYDDDGWDAGPLRGRYFSESNVISFWRSPFGPNSHNGKRDLSFTVSELKKVVDIDTRTLLVDLWEDDMGLVPYVWFFDGFMDDFGEKIVQVMPQGDDRKWYKVTFRGGRELYCDLNGRMLTFLEYMEIKK